MGKPLSADRQRFFYVSISTQKIVAVSQQRL